MTRVISIIGGKGGIGKTTLSCNLATALAECGENVVCCDANLTTPNLGLHLGFHLAPNTLHDILKGKAKLKDATYPHSLGFNVIPGSLSVNDLQDVDVGKLPEVALSLMGKYDYVLFDSAAGLGREAISAIKSADEILVITNPDMPSVADALKTIKIAEELNKKILGVVVNKVSNTQSLQKEDIEYMLGYDVLAEIPYDRAVEKAIDAKNPVVAFDPNSPASIEFKRLAHAIVGKDFVYKKSRASMFFDKLSRLFKR